MTINKVIENADRVKPNAFSEDDKAGWVIKVDGMVNAEIVKNSDYVAPEYPDGGEAVLLVPAPFDDLYQIYIEAQMARLLQDIDEHNNLIVLYNSAFNDYAAYYRRNNLPASSAVVTNIW